MTSPRRTRISQWSGEVGIAVLAFFAGVFVRSVLRQPTWAHFSGLLWEWQTLIAGVGAVGAAVVTIRVTRRAAAEQVGAAERQTDAMRTAERHRIASEAYAFFTMMAGAMESVLDDVEEARKIRATTGGPVSAYRARTQVKKAGFSELRTACLRYGGQMVTPNFLRLDKMIDDFSSVPKGDISANTAMEVGLDQELDHIEVLAKGLRDEVGPGIDRCIKLLAETQEPDFP
jgi:hypothetical protein